MQSQLLICVVDATQSWPWADSLGERSTLDLWMTGSTIILYLALRYLDLTRWMSRFSIIIIMKLILIICFGDTVTVSHLRNVIQTQKCVETGSWLCDDMCVLQWWYFYGSCADAKNVCQSLILEAIKEYSLNARAVKLIIMVLEILTSFAAFAADLASIHKFRSVDRRHWDQDQSKLVGRHCNLLVSAPAWDGTGTGPEFDPWQCRIHIPLFIEPTIAWVLGTSGYIWHYGLTQKVC